MLKRQNPNGLIEIYALSDPRTGVIRYVGQSNNAKRRLVSHLNPGPTVKTTILEWIKDLESERLKPILLILQKVPASQADQAEKQWIDFHRSDCLLNNPRQYGRKSVLSEPVVSVITVRGTQAMRDAWDDEDFRNKIRLYWEKEAKLFLNEKPQPGI